MWSRRGACNMRRVPGNARNKHVHGAVELQHCGLHVAQLELSRNFQRCLALLERCKLTGLRREASALRQIAASLAPQTRCCC